jgi:hypothetical protein
MEKAQLGFPFLKKVVKPSAPEQKHRQFIVLLHPVQRPVLTLQSVSDEHSGVSIDPGYVTLRE